LEPWQDRGIELLLTTSISHPRVNDVAIGSGYALVRCNDPRLSGWFIAQMDAALTSGDWIRLPGLRQTIARGAGRNAAIDEYLRRTMRDASVPGGFRASAGAWFLSTREPPERLREYVDAFGAGELPPGTAGARGSYGKPQKMTEAC
jgi:hypothetical protein